MTRTQCQKNADEAIIDLQAQISEVGVKVTRQCNEIMRYGQIVIGPAGSGKVRRYGMIGMTSTVLLLHSPPTAAQLLSTVRL